MYKLIVNEIDIISSSNNISWSSDSDTLGTQLTFESIKDLREGAVISFFNDYRELIRGRIIKKVINRDTFNYVVQDYSSYLRNKVIKQFNGASASNAINSFLSEAYIQGNICDIPTIITKIYINESLADILDDILEQAKNDQGIDYVKEIEGTTLYIRKLNDMKINPKIYISKDVSIDSSIENMKNKIQVISNSSKNNAVYATSEATGSYDYYGILSDIVEVDEKNIAQAKNIANNTLNESNSIQRSTTIEGIAFSGADDIKAKRMIYLDLGSKLTGYYKIKSATHTLDKTLHKISLNIEWKVKV